MRTVYVNVRDTVGGSGKVSWIRDNLNGGSIVDLVANTARVSYDAEPSERSHSDNLKLFRYLLGHKHMSPFEHAIFTFHITAPQFVAVHFLRHRTAKVNMQSFRYTQIDDAFYIPEVFRAQSKKNKQSSFGEVEQQDYFRKRWKSVLGEVNELYHQMIDAGIAREQARGIMPFGTFTSWYWTMDFRNLLHFLGLRLSKDAQEETRLYAQALEGLLLDIDHEAMEIARTVGYANI